MRLVLFTRFPEPGMAKTRLIPVAGPAGAARVHTILTETITGILRNSAQGRSDISVEIRYTGGEEDYFSGWLGQDISYQPQCEGDLTDRLLDAAASPPVILFGSDTPDLSVDIVSEALESLHSHDAVIGPALDGGYYLLGMREPHDLFTGVNWSTEHVLDETIAKLKAAELSYHILPALSDCDTPEDLKRWPSLMQAAKDDGHNP